MENYELTEFKNLENYGRSPKFSKNFRELDWTFIRNYIEDNKMIINCVEVGIAEDWGSTSEEIWTKEIGYLPYNKYLLTRSRIGNPAILVEFSDSAILTFICSKVEYTRWDKFLNFFKDIVGGK